MLARAQPGRSAKATPALHGGQWTTKVGEAACVVMAWLSVCLLAAWW